jgi:predicted AAA+ superfamily ATPase
MAQFRRPAFDVLLARLREPRRRIQVLAGPRQTGKTTLARQVLDAVDLPAHYATADDPVGQDPAWLRAQWEVARQRSVDGPAVLVLDEAQKIPRWSEHVKLLWDEDDAARRQLHVVLLGSAPLLVARGLTESLAGRFELIHVTHWSLPEMRAAFTWDVDAYLAYGGYPGGAELVGDPQRWAAYIRDALLETTISRDILSMERVEKPALLRRLFGLATEYSGQVLSYTKMLGQLQDAGNTTTLAHYLDLLDSAGLARGLSKFSGGPRKRGSSPKLLVRNTALMTATAGLDAASARADTTFWGRLAESAVGAHLVNTSIGTNIDVAYWRERDKEVDFVLSRRRSLVAIEVKSGAATLRSSGLDAFLREHPRARPLIVGTGGLALGEFLSAPAEAWFT